MIKASNRSNWSTIVSYLKSHSSYLGLKQERFTILLPNGLPDYQIDTVNGTPVKRVKVNRPMAFCFDYLQLKDTFGLELETEIVSDIVDVSDNDKNNEHDSSFGNEISQHGELQF